MSRITNVVGSMECRLKWYQKAIDMACGVIPWENGFNWPSSTNPITTDPTAIQEWRGAARELCNSLAMLHDAINH